MLLLVPEATMAGAADIYGKPEPFYIFVMF
jgi:hypothetical protein